MKANELREKSVAELNEQLDSLYKDRFAIRMQKSTGQLGQPHLVAANRKDIARVKTIISEKEKVGS
ncbi:MAG: 50S ribosomal protein L29 [Pseudohongiellaceae bacterium]|nr:50S ribosomal protein L29 [Pseudohongiellaceae bacterium]